MSERRERDPVALPRTYRPVGSRVAGIVAGATILIAMVFLWLSFSPEVRASVTGLQRGTVIGIGILGFTVLHALTRSRVVARERGLTVVNGYRRHELEWAEVFAVRLPPGAPWVTLDLTDGTTVSALGIQASDGVRSRRAVRELRAVLDGDVA